MMKFKFLMVEMTEAEWDRLQKELIREYGKSILLSWCMRRQMGCVRRHGHLPDGEYPRTRVFLDFFDEISYTTFILRYS